MKVKVRKVSAVKLGWFLGQKITGSYLEEVIFRKFRGEVYFCAGRMFLNTIMTLSAGCFVLGLAMVFVGIGVHILMSELGLPYDHKVFTLSFITMIVGGVLFFVSSPALLCVYSFPPFVYFMWGNVPVGLREFLAGIEKACDANIVEIAEFTEAEFKAKVVDRLVGMATSVLLFQAVDQEESAAMIKDELLFAHKHATDLFVLTKKQTIGWVFAKAKERLDNSAKTYDRMLEDIGQVLESRACPK